MPAGESTRRKYPGLLPAEVLVWRAFCRLHEEDFTAFEYNVHVGQGVPPPPPAPGVPPDVQAASERAWRLSTQRKIDVVGHRPGETWIIEVERHGGVTALGQLVAYDQLWRQAGPGPFNVQLALVCVDVEQDMLGAFEDQAIAVYTVSVPELETQPPPGGPSPEL